MPFFTSLCQCVMRIACKDRSWYSEIVVDIQSHLVVNINFKLLMCHIHYELYSAAHCCCLLVEAPWQPWTFHSAAAELSSGGFQTSAGNTAYSGLYLIFFCIFHLFFWCSNVDSLNIVDFYFRYLSLWIGLLLSHLFHYFSSFKAS